MKSSPAPYECRTAHVEVFHVVPLVPFPAREGVASHSETG